VKRSEPLAILSRDHHRALFIAQKLRRAEPGSAGGERRRFLEFWDSQGRRHFQLEEEILLPAYAEHGDPYHPLVLQVLGDHVAIRAHAKRIAARSDVTTDALQKLGTALAAHVRLEERELFAVIESAIPAHDLLLLARFLERVEMHHDAPAV
jgi:hypothetical protein